MRKNTFMSYWAYFYHFYTIILCSLLRVHHSKILKKFNSLSYFSANLKRNRKMFLRFFAHAGVIFNFKAIRGPIIR